MLGDISESPLKTISAPSVWGWPGTAHCTPPMSKQVQFPVLLNISVNVGL